MTVPTGAWHESVRRDERPPRTSERSFGFVFAAAFTVLGSLSMWRGRESGVWLLVIAGSFLGFAVFSPTVLAPLNRLSSWIGLRLHAVVNPVVMAVLFYGVVTPIGLLMHLIGKDALRLRFDRSVPSYWIARPLASEEKPSMKLQF